MSGETRDWLLLEDKMSVLTPDEKASFVEAASAYLAAQERLELLKEQGIEKLGGKPGRVPVPQHQVEAVMAPGREVFRVLVEIMKKHPALPAIRFRGFLFNLDIRDGKAHSLLLTRESEIETIDG
jgi:hypothetical protein